MHKLLKFVKNYYIFVIIHIGIITMRFNKTTEYAFRVFALMATNKTKLYRADELFNFLKIPRSYLRKLLTELSKTGLMESIQGNKGGYRLSRDTNEISLMDIVRATESQDDNKQCFFGLSECKFGKKCKMHDNWISIIERIEHLLITTTLSDLEDIETQKHIFDNMHL